MTTQTKAEKDAATEEARLAAMNGNCDGVIMGGTISPLVGIVEVKVLRSLVQGLDSGHRLVFVAEEGALSSAVTLLNAGGKQVQFPTDSS